MQDGEQSGGSSLFTNRRGMSSTTALIVLVVVVIIAGAGAYGGLSSVPSKTTTVKSCVPANICVTSHVTNDVTMFIPYTVAYGQTYSQSAVGTSIQATVAVTGSETIKTFAVQWGPGIVTSGPTGTLSYTYAQPGLYTLVANATDTTGLIHTGTGQLASLKINPTAASISYGYFPTLSTTLMNTSGGYYGWIGAGGTVTLNGTYAHPPANPTWAAAAPTLTVPTGVQQSNLHGTSTYASATYTFPNPGYYGVTLVVPSSNATATKYQNFTWGIYVAASATGLGCKLCTVPVQASPHKNTFYNYEPIPGGALDLDPAADYYSVGYEVGEAFDESLITFNGTDSGSTYQNFVPQIATCVPGSPLCTKLYGSTLVSGTNVTFVIDPAAHFYDPYTGVSREVYPSDVMFSVIRAILYTQIYGATGYYVGFDIAGPLVPYQALEPTEVNPNWDLGPGGIALHAPYNNTPYYTLSAFGVNDSNCPSIAMSQANGCITFHANADSKAWPALLLILSIISADGAQEAGWYTQQGADVPGFDCPGLSLSTPNPDLPCLLPGGVTSTSDSGFQTWVANSLTGTSGADSPYGWDNEVVADTNYPIPVPGVSFKEVGSGPYYLSYADPGVGYTLKASPSYQAPTGCKGQVGCLPLPGQYVQNVVDYWEPSDTVGISEAEAGFADAVAFESPDYGTMLSLVQSGQLGLIDFPGLLTDNYAFNTQIDLPLLATFDSSPPHPINIPADAFSYIGLRSVLEYAYPYATAQVLENVIDGVDLGNPFGGFLPPSESAYYNTLTPWPNYDNVTGVWSNPSTGTGAGTAAWYWTEATTSGNPYYDPELASFSSSNPLYIPTLGFTSTPNINAAEVAWGHEVSTITGGVVQFQQFFVPSTTEDFTYTSPGEVPWALWLVTWIPDYPAPVNNWEGAYGTGLWGAADALTQTFDGDYGGSYNNTATCGHYNPTIANMTYWALAQPDNIIPQDCQGTAWNVTLAFVVNATYNLNTPVAQLLWNLVQDVYNNLQLTVGTTAGNVVFNYAPWVNPASINENVLVGGGIEWYYQGLAGNGLF